MAVTQEQIKELLAIPEVKFVVDSLANKIKALNFDLNNFAAITQNHRLIDTIQIDHMEFDFKNFRAENKELIQSEHFNKIVLESHPEIAGAMKAHCYLDGAVLGNKITSFPMTYRSNDTIHEFNNPSEIFLFTTQRCDKKFSGVVTSVDADIAKYVTEQTAEIGALPYSTHSDEL